MLLFVLFPSLLFSFTMIYFHWYYFHFSLIFIIIFFFFCEIICYTFFINVFISSPRIYFLSCCTLFIRFAIFCFLFFPYNSIFRIFFFFENPVHLILVLLNCCGIFLLLLVALLYLFYSFSFYLFPNHQRHCLRSYNSWRFLDSNFIPLHHPLRNPNALRTRGFFIHFILHIFIIRLVLFEDYRFIFFSP